MEVATQRAYVMALIAFGAKLFDRPAISLRSLAVAMAVIVLLQPESVVAPGFQMSFAASAGLVALYEIWPRLDRPEGAGPLGRVGGWIVGAAATSLVASLATMPFALHHFDRAALFSVLANMAATPIISFWTTPAALAAAVAAPFGLDGIFLSLMGHSLALVTDIAHLSADLSPPIDLPRLSAAGLGLAAAAIGVFCVMRGAGRLAALAPGLAAALLWSDAPRTLGYVATDGSVFLKAESGWVELTRWRGENGLNPLAIRGRPMRDPCGRQAETCAIETPDGVFEMSADKMPARPASSPVTSGAAATLAPLPGPATAQPPSTSMTVCPSAASLAFRPRTPDDQQPSRAEPVPLDPCALATSGGAVIGIDRRGQLQLLSNPPEQGRPWAP
jgi:competence protein ComEC